jgi:zinc transport system substrate-binding protein
VKTLRAATALLLLALLAGIPACSRPGTQAAPRVEANSAIGVFVSIPPMQYLANAVGGQRVRVEVLVQPGQDPHTYEPTPRQMSLLAQATVFFRVGIDFENALVPRLRESAPGLRIVDTREGITLRPAEEGDQAHGEGALDPHIWMSPLLARRQAQSIRDALIDLDPAGRGQYEQGYARLAAKLEALHAEITAALAPYRGRELFVYHPAFGYFADAYGLGQVAVETGGKEPSARQLARLIEQARQRHVRVIFVQPQFSQAAARAVADAIGGAVVPLDDLAADYVANLREVARRVAAGLSGASSSAETGKGGS